MTIFKICGLRDASHALVAAEAGASFLGFNFVHGVRRQLMEEQGQAIIQEYRRQRDAGGPKLVGLFANQPLDEVNRIIASCGLDFAQLCGDEPPAYWRRVDAPVFRQVKVREYPSMDMTISETLRQVEEVVQNDGIPLLDRYEEGALGGTGRAFNWSIAARVAEEYDIILAGGLTPENVKEAISTVNPWAVDVSSGVETGGIKDPRKIVAFAQAARNASGPKLDSAWGK